VSLPALVISIPVEGRPRLFLDARTEDEELRLLDWLGHSPVLLHTAAMLLELLGELIEEREEPVASNPGLRLVDPNAEALLRALDQVAGRCFLGAVIGGDDGIELVFSGEQGENLLTIYVGGPRVGQVVLGGVADPAGYVKAGSRRRPWGWRR
jgi:hypothetical protein